MAGNVSIRNYKDLYTVEFSSQSLGCTLIATWDKSEAEAEYERFKNMTESEMIDYLNSKNNPLPPATASGD